MNILLLGATGSIGESVLSVIEQNHSELNLFGITFHKNINTSQELLKISNLNLHMLKTGLHLKTKKIQVILLFLMETLR